MNPYLSRRNTLLKKKSKNINFMWLHSNPFSKFAVFALIVAMLVSGSFSGLHASVSSNHLDDGYQIASTEKANVDDREGSAHHPSGEPECHNAQCNLYSPLLSSSSDVVSYGRVVFAIETEQRPRSITEFLYRPPKVLV